ncbi:MAG: hypothetical protein ACOC3V_03355 [bacterium]
MKLIAFLLAWLTITLVLHLVLTVIATFIIPLVVLLFTWSYNETNTMFINNIHLYVEYFKIINGFIVLFALFITIPAVIDSENIY